jgi:methionine--tRNA ligase beta chain
MVTLEEFAHIDIRVGKIVEVNDISTRKPMYGLRVDLGELGIKSIVAGIKDRYTKEQLLGRKVVIVANLEAKNIAGFVSEGMILAAEDGANLSLLQPDNDILQGTKVR